MRARDVGRRRWDVPETQNRLGPLSLSFEVGQTQRTHCPRTRVPLNTRGTKKCLHSGGGHRRAATSRRLGIQQESAMRKVRMRSSRDPDPEPANGRVRLQLQLRLAHRGLPFGHVSDVQRSTFLRVGGTYHSIDARVRSCSPVEARPRPTIRSTRLVSLVSSRAETPAKCGMRARGRQKVANGTGLPPTLSSVWLTRLCVETSARPPAVHRRSFVLVRVGLARSCCSPSRLQPS